MKKLVTTAFFALSVMALNAQNLDSAVNSATSQVTKIVYSVLGLIFLIGVLLNISKLWGENKDIKGFFVNIFLFFIVCLAIGGIYTAITSLSI